MTRLSSLIAVFLLMSTTSFGRAGQSHVTSVNVRCGNLTPDPVFPCHGCQVIKASGGPARLQVIRGSYVSWHVHPSSSWTINFDSKSPFAHLTVKPGHPSQKVTGAAGEYSYTVSIHGCKEGVHGSITVQ